MQMFVVGETEFITLKKNLYSINKKTLIKVLANEFIFRRCAAGQAYPRRSI